MELERERRVGESLGGGTGEVEDLKEQLEDASQELTVVLRRGIVRRFLNSGLRLYLICGEYLRRRVLGRKRRRRRRGCCMNV